MKKIATGILLCAISALMAAAPAYADEGIAETPNVKIIIEGKTASFTNVPVVINGRTFLPFREILKNLGVPDDEQHIIWNGDEKSVTVKSQLNGSDQTIFMKVGETAASVNGTGTVLDAAPVIYKDSTYIPVRFVAQSLGKTVVWDGSTTTVLIRDTAEFNKVKALIEKCNSATNNVKRFKAGGTINIDMEFNGVPNVKNVNSQVKVDILSDLEKKAVLMNEDITGSAPEFEKGVNVQVYYAGNAVYVKNPADGGWMKKELNIDEFNKALKQSAGNSLDLTDTLYAGLVIDPNPPEGKVVLSGEMYIQNLLKNITSSINAGASNVKFDISKYFMKLVYDSNTNILEKEIIDMQVNYTMPNNVTASMKASGEIAYSDYDGNFGVSAPEGIDKAIAMQ